MFRRWRNWICLFFSLSEFLAVWIFPIFSFLHFNHGSYQFNLYVVVLDKSKFKFPVCVMWNIMVEKKGKKSFSFFTEFSQNFSVEWRKKQQHQLRIWFICMMTTCMHNRKSKLFISDILHIEKEKRMNNNCAT